MIASMFYNADGRPISSEEFLESLYVKLPEFFKDEEELRKIWSVPSNHKALLKQLEKAGYGRDDLLNLQKLINAEKSDLFDVLEYVSFAVKPISREARIVGARSQIFDGLARNQRDFLSFVLSKYIESGVGELDQEKLPGLLELKYQSITDATEKLGGIEAIKNTFIGFQKFLY
jgi:type I restriction enzyme R subunit